MKPLERFTDLLQHMQEEEDLRRQREDWPSITIEGDVPRRKREEAEAEARSRVLECRLCGHTGRTDYCPECLAFSMEPVATPEPNPAQTDPAESESAEPEPGQAPPEQ